MTAAPYGPAPFRKPGAGLWLGLVERYDQFKDPEQVAKIPLLHTVEGRVLPPFFLQGELVACCRLKSIRRYGCLSPFNLTFRATQQPTRSVVFGGCGPPQPNFPKIYQRLRLERGANHAPFPCCRAVPNTPQRFQRLTASPNSSVQHGCDTGPGRCSRGVRDQLCLPAT